MRTGALFLFLLVGVSAHGQTFSSSCLKPQAGEIGARAAIESASAFLRALGQSPGRREGMWVSLEQVGAFRDWTVYTEGRSYLVSVHARTGQVMSYHNQARRQAQFRSKPMTGRQPFFFRTERIARDHIALYARLTNVAATAKLDPIVVKRDGEVADASRSGYVGAIYRDAKGNVVATFSFDPKDGVLTDFSRTWSN